MAAEKMFVGDVGTVREYVIVDEDNETLVPLDSLSALFVRYRKPDRTTFDRDLTSHETEDSVALYEFVAGELDQKGWWKAAYRAEFADGRGWWSEWEWFKVEQHIEQNEAS